MDVEIFKDFKVIMESKWTCGKQRGAESHGSGAWPAVRAPMSVIAAPHPTRITQRSSSRIKGGVTTLKDERGPGLDYMLLCFIMFTCFTFVLLSIYLVIKVMLTVCRFPPPSLINARYCNREIWRAIEQS